MRLDKYLSNAGLGSRKEVKLLLKKGRVRVNGDLVKQPEYSLNKMDIVLVDDLAVQYEEFVYFLMNKPIGVLSATKDMEQLTVLDLLSDEDYRADLFPVGRLDKDTTGLLLLTNDGQLNHQLLSPKKHVAKDYIAQIAGIMNQEDQEKFADGILLSNGEICKPAKLEVLDSNRSDDTSTVKITLVEGKYHQVKRMVAACGKKVETLKRISMGSLLLDERLAEGEYRRLTETELKQLKKDK